MSPQESRGEHLSRVTNELAAAILEQARGRWKGVKTAQRNEGSRHVWRFRMGTDSVERFLHVPHQTLVKTRDAAGLVMGQLREEHWLDRLQAGPETSFLLSPNGRLRPWPKQ